MNTPGSKQSSSQADVQLPANKHQGPTALWQENANLRAVRSQTPKRVNGPFSTVPSKMPGLHSCLGRTAQDWLSRARSPPGAPAASHHGLGGPVHDATFLGSGWPVATGPLSGPNQLLGVGACPPGALWVPSGRRSGYSLHPRLPSSFWVRHFSPAPRSPSPYFADPTAPNCRWAPTKGEPGAARQGDTETIGTSKLVSEARVSEGPGGACTTGDIQGVLPEAAFPPGPSPRIPPRTDSPLRTSRNANSDHSRFTDGNSEQLAGEDRTVPRGQASGPAAVPGTASPPCQSGRAPVCVCARACVHVHVCASSLFTERRPLSPNCQTGSLTKKINLKFLKYQNLKNV